MRVRWERIRVLQSSTRIQLAALAGVEDTQGTCWRAKDVDDGFNHLTPPVVLPPSHSGFVESPITFPPSYKYSTHRIPDYTNPSELTTTTFSPLCVPSYTDRILTHSLPDAHTLHHESYFLCPSITGSDHRPVSLALRLDTHSSAVTGYLAAW